MTATSGLVRAGLGAAVLAAALALSACARTDASLAAAPAPTGMVHAVQMTSTYSYNPLEVRVRVGDTVEWRNVAPWAQTVTALRAASPRQVELPTGAAEFDSGRIPAGATYRHTFTVPGRYQYVSVANVETDMVGTIVVLDR